ncbi:MAG: hypothetical protein J6Y00_03865 [Paludibacteraceae bacterium]|nr:hypothetical protein [Paludibacteraceae bacterium]
MKKPTNHFKRKDYESMRTSMIYGDSPSWQELMDSLNNLQEQIKDLPYRA